jgi:hypothetical protein
VVVVNSGSDCNFMETYTGQVWLSDQIKWRENPKNNQIHRESGEKTPIPPIK